MTSESYTELMGSFPAYVHSLSVWFLVAIPACVAIFITAGINRVDFDIKVKWQFALYVILYMSVWSMLASWISAQGFFVQTKEGVPLIPIFFVFSIILPAWLLYRSKVVKAMLVATPIYWLILLQTYRIGGIIFVLLALDGILPTQFALVSGPGDTLVGILAIFATYLVAKDPVKNLWAAWGWNSLSIIDLALALSLGAISAPGAIQLIALDYTVDKMGIHPMPLVPVLLVPMSILLNLMSIWQVKLFSQKLKSSG